MWGAGQKFICFCSVTCPSGTELKINHWNDNKNYSYMNIHFLRFTRHGKNGMGGGQEKELLSILHLEPQPTQLSAIDAKKLRICCSINWALHNHQFEIATVPWHESSDRRINRVRAVAVIGRLGELLAASHTTSHNPSRHRRCSVLSFRSLRDSIAIFIYHQSTLSFHRI